LKRGSTPKSSWRRRPIRSPAFETRVDAQVLEIFLEEAAELYPQAGDQVRAWRRQPQDMHVAQQLRRTLHTFKGSARMAGAMRLGELTHLMESRLLQGDTPREPTPDLFEALDTDLDHIAFVLDALREGRANVPLPEFDRRGKDRDADSASVATELETPSPAVSPTVIPLAHATPAPVATPAAEHADVEAARAMLRVRADIVDRLVNEAGEVAIARARIEGELSGAEIEPARTHEQRDPFADASAGDRVAGGNADPIADCRRSRRSIRNSILSSSTASPVSRNSTRSLVEA
jgi:chemosensory pili system protein ChpA (sensor histidine kinase/response regulator)